LAVGTAAAAVVLVMLYLKPFAGPIDVEVPAEILLSEMTEPVSPEVDKLAEEIDRLQVQVKAYASASAGERTLDPDQFDFQIEALWLTEATESDRW